MSQDFDNELQEKKIEDLKKREEEDLISALASGRYDLPYANLLTEKIENEALALVEEKTARALKVGAYKTLGKKAYLAVHSPNTEGISQVVEDFSRRRGPRWWNRHFSKNSKRDGGATQNNH